MAATRAQRAYDHRLRELVRSTGDVALAARASVPRSTAAGWLRGSGARVVAAPDAALPEEALVAEVARLRRRVQRLRALLRVLLAVARVFGIDLARRRVPDGQGKRRLLRAIDRAREVLSLAASSASPLAVSLPDPARPRDGDVPGPPPRADRDTRPAGPAWTPPCATPRKNAQQDEHQGRKERKSGGFSRPRGARETP